MNKRVCSKCKLTKENLEFYQRKSGSRAGNYYEICKNCFKLRGKSYYHNNHERQLKLAKIRVGKYLETRRSILLKLKNKPCVDCKIFYPPWKMDFDHLDGNLKSGNIAYLFRRGSWKVEKVLKEIEKCDLVCANCHRERTYLRGKRNYDNILKKLKDEGYRLLWDNSNILPR